MSETAETLELCQLVEIRNQVHSQVEVCECAILRVEAVEVLNLVFTEMQHFQASLVADFIEILDLVLGLYVLGPNKNIWSCHTK